MRRPPTAPLPATAAESADGHETAATIRVTLDPELTAALLQQVPRRHRIRPNELLITALCVTLSRWTGTNDVLIDLEGHGRESPIPGLDLSRTVGWFTSLYPLIVALPREAAPSELLATVRRRMRSVPDGGIGYGLLRYLNADSTVRSELAAQGSAPVLFNYLGRKGLSAGTDVVLEPCRELELSRSSRLSRRHEIEINAFNEASCLAIDWTFGTDRHSETAIEARAEEMLEVVRELVRHCLREEAAVDSESFPLVQLDRAELDKLSALLQKKDG